MELSIADRVWNRAAVKSGGDAPRAGDRALASLLLVHGLIMNGGVHHAIECVESHELLAAADGYAFFGFDAVAALLRGAPGDPVLSICTDDTEFVANRRYAGMLPDDSLLHARFQQVFRARADEFSPLD